MKSSTLSELFTSGYRKDDRMHHNHWIQKGYFPLEFAWPGFFGDWCVYHEPLAFHWFQKSNRTFIPMSVYGHDSFTRKIDHQEKSLRINGFWYKIPGTMFIDQVFELEWNTSMGHYVRVFYIPSTKLPHKTIMTILLQLWSSWGKRHLHSTHLIDTNRMIFRTHDWSFECVFTIDQIEKEWSLINIRKRLRQIENQYVHHILFLSLPSRTRQGSIYSQKKQTDIVKRLPNLKYSCAWYPPEFIEKKKQMALKYQDWSLIPYLSTDRRQRCIQQQIYTLRHLCHQRNIDGVCSCLEQITILLKHCFPFQCSKRELYLKQLIWINTCPHAPLYSIESTSLLSVYSQKRMAMIDFEWIPSFSKGQFEKLYLIGVYIPYLDVYQSFWVQHPSPYQEIIIIHKMFTFLQQQEISCIAYYFAEQPFLQRWISRYSTFLDTMNESIKTMFLSIQHLYNSVWLPNSVDVYSLVTQLPFVIRGSFTSKLKDLHKAMFTHGFSTISPLESKETISNALDSIQMAKTLYYSKCHPRRKDLRDQLLLYNQQDCRILADLLSFLYKI